MASNPFHPETLVGYGASRIDLAQRKFDGFALLAIHHSSDEFEDLLTAKGAVGSARWNSSPWLSLALALATS
jgi:hypothetical protein